MPQKIVVNGKEYDSPDAMPPDVRREYERALKLTQDLGKGIGPRGSTEKTVEAVPGGVSVNVHTERVQYKVDGKTYDDPSQLPPEVRARFAGALGGGAQLDVRNDSRPEVRRVEIHTEVRRSAVPWLIWGVLIAAIVALVIWF